jgi:hypothetical protein
MEVLMSSPVRVLRAFIDTLYLNAYQTDASFQIVKKAMNHPFAKKQGFVLIKLADDSLSWQLKGGHCHKARELSRNG